MFLPEWRDDVINNLSIIDDMIGDLTGRDVTLVQQYAAVGALSFPLFWIAGAGSAVFWVIGTYSLLIPPF